MAEYTCNHVSGYVERVECVGGPTKTIHSLDEHSPNPVHGKCMLSVATELEKLEIEYPRVTAEMVAVQSRKGSSWRKVGR